MPYRASYLPKLVTVLREGYSVVNLRADALAGLTVAIVALPLSMAIAIASHAPPAAGIYASIIGGFLVSALGGSRYQIGGPAGAFIVLVASIIDSYGMDGLLLASIMAGAMMLVAGVLRLGSLVRLVPHAVIVGFSSGIAVIIFASQVKELLGITLAETVPGGLFNKFVALWRASGTINPLALMVSVLAILVILAVRKLRPTLPAFLFAVAGSALLVGMGGLDVATIGTRFGGIPNNLPMPRLPAFDMAKLYSLLPSAFSLFLLGSIESLLSAVVADNMKGRQHRSNAELLAQGVANLVTPLFGGITVTGTIARTATNVRAGAQGPMAGMLHSSFLLLFMLVAAPLASFVPLAALAAILVVVSWNMFERSEVVRLLGRRDTGAVLMVTFLLTVSVDLLTGIAAGLAMSGAMSLFNRSSDVSDS